MRPNATSAPVSAEKYASAKKNHAIHSIYDTRIKSGKVITLTN